MQSLDPIIIYQIPKVFGFWAQGVGMDEIQYVYFNVLQAFVAWKVEMFPNLTFWCVECYGVKVSLEPVHTTVLCLSHVLYATCKFPQMQTRANQVSNK